MSVRDCFNKAGYTKKEIDEAKQRLGVKRISEAFLNDFIENETGEVSAKRTELEGMQNKVREAVGLDPVTRPTLEQKVQEIDSAIGEAESRLKRLKDQQVAKLAEQKQTSPARFAQRAKSADSRLPEEFRGLIGEDLLNRVKITNSVTNEQADALMEKLTEDEAVRIVSDIGTRLSVRALIGQKLVRSLSTRASKSTSQKEKASLYDKAITVLKETVEIAREAGRGVQIFSVWRHMGPEGYLYYATKSLDEIKTNIEKRYNRTIKDVLKAHKTGVSTAINQLVTQPGKSFVLTEKAKQIREEALKKIKRGRENLTFGGFSPELIEGLVEYGYSLILEGVDNFKAFSRNLKKQFNFLTDEDVSQVWEQEFEGIKLKDRASGAFGKFLRENISDPDLSQRIREHFDLTKDQADRLVDTINTIITSEVKKSIERSIPRSHREMREFAEELANLRSITSDDVINLRMKQLGFPEKVSKENIDKITKAASTLDTLPENSYLKDQGVAEILAEVYRILGDNSPEWLGQKPKSIVWPLWYAFILSGPKTHVLNFGANGVKAMVENYVTAIDAVIQSKRQKNLDVLKEAYLPMLEMTKEMFSTGIHRKALSDVADIMVRGEQKRDDFAKFFQRDVLEERAKKNVIGGIKGLVKQDGTADLSNLNILNNAATFGKWFIRSMAAVDSWFFWGHYTGRIAQLVIRAEIADGKKGQEINKAVAEVMNGGALGIEDARAQAREELAKATLPSGRELTPRDERLRTQEILEEKLDELYGPEIRESAYRWGQLGTFTEQPQGTLGWATELAEQIRRRYPGLTLIIPFLKILTNVANSQLNYVPFIGYRRSLGKSGIPFKKSGGIGQELSYEERRRVAIKAWTGFFLMLSSLGLWALFDPEDDDFPVKLHGNGPRDFNKLLQLKGTNWQANSFQVGDTYLTFKELEIGPWLSLMGNTFDAARYKTLSDDKVTAAGEMAWYFIQSAPETILGGTLFSGIGGLFSLLLDLSKASPEKGADKLARWLLDQTKVVQPNVYRQIAQSFDPKFYIATDWKSRFYKNHFQPTLSLFNKETKLMVYQNALGDEIKWSRSDDDWANKTLSIVGFNRFVNIAEADPIYQLLVDKNIFIKPLGNIQDEDGNPLYQTDRARFLRINKRRGELIKENILNNLDRYRAMSRKDLQKLLDEKLKDRGKRSITTRAKRVQ